MEFLKYIYVAGPYTKPDPVVNTRRAILVGDDLRKLGFVPFIPHLTHFWHLVSPQPYEEWLAYDNEWLPKCDAVYRIAGESSGADKECDLAGSLNIPVFASIVDLINERKRRSIGEATQPNAFVKWFEAIGLRPKERSC